MFLYRSQIEIELCRIMDHILLWESGLRGGWSGVSGLRAALANHPYLANVFDPTQLMRFLLDLDVVGLYR